MKSSEEKALVADAEALRAEFLDIFTWAFRDGSHDADLKRIREGDGVADLVADLGDLVKPSSRRSPRPPHRLSSITEVTSWSNGNSAAVKKSSKTFDSPG